jgi:predicted nucleotidyltransferase component of viral defense system
MITKLELEKYARVRGIKNLGHAEVDYFQNILLFILYKNFGKNLVFKGGTALSKCYGLLRFSEDLDFTAEKEINDKIIWEELKRFMIEFTSEKKNYENGIKYIIKINGPLFIGTKNSLCRIIIDISLREKVVLKPEIKSIGRFMEEMPIFDVLVMDKKEIFSEKIRAIMTRNKARDVYDLSFLAKEKEENYFDISLINEKLKYYNKKWSEKEFISSLNEKKNIWLTELTPLLDNTPEFKSAKKEILGAIGLEKSSVK